VKPVHSTRRSVALATLAFAWSAASAVAAPQDAPKAEPPKPEAPAAEPAKPDAPKSESAGQDAPKDDAAKSESAKPGRPNLEHFFPADVQAFVAIDDVDALITEWRASAWGKLFLDEKAAAARAAFDGVLEAVTKQSTEALGFDAVAAAHEVKGRLGGAFGGLFGGAASTAAGGESPDVVGTLVADVGEHGAEIVEKVAASLQKSAEQGKGIVKQATAKTGDYSALVSKDEGKESYLAVATVGETLAIGAADGPLSEHNRFTQLLESLAGEGGESLASQADFKQSLAARAGGVKLMFDVGGAVRESFSDQEKAIAHYAEDKRMAPFVDRMKAQIDLQRELGLAELGRLTGRFLLDGRGARLETHLAWHDGWLPKLAMAWFTPDDGALLKLVPADALQVLTLHLDLVAGMDKASEAKKELKSLPLLGIPIGTDDAPPPTPDGAAPGAEAPFDARKDVIDHLDGRVALFTATVDESEALPGGLFDEKTPTNAALVLGVKNAEALRATIDKLLRMQGWHAIRKRSEFEGFEVFSLPLGPMTLNYAIVADFLVLSPSATLLQDVLRRKSHVELPNLASNAVFHRQYDGLTRAPSILLWAKLSPSATTSMLAQLLLPRRRTPPPHFAGTDDGGDGNDDGDGDEPKGGAAAGEAPDLLETRMQAFVEAVGKLDAKLVTDTVPGGVVAGLSVAKDGVTVEGVSR
jgi:hypothetical protein